MGLIRLIPFVLAFVAANAASVKTHKRCEAPATLHWADNAAPAGCAGEVSCPTCYPGTPYLITGNAAYEYCLSSASCIPFTK